MIITALAIENFKRIEDLELEQPGHYILLTGTNGAGKSTVLDAILKALKNTGSEDPIRHGANKAIITLRISGEDREYEVVRKQTRSGMALNVTDTAENKRVPKPQEFLDGLTGMICFDPLQLLHLKGKKQAELLRDLLGLDFTDLDIRYKEAFEERTVVNREVKALTNKLDGKKKPPKDLPDKPVDVAELSEQVRRAEQAAFRLKNLEEKRQQLMEELKRVEASIEETTKEVVSDEELQTLKTRLSTANEVNGAIRDAQQYRELRNDLKAKEMESKDLTATLEGIRATKEQELTKAFGGLDVGGDLTIDDDDGIFYNGIRFDQLSTGQQTRLSAIIGMQGNPDLKIMMIREGALLSRENHRVLAETAEERGYQLWIEKFREESEDGSLHIVDGHIVESEQQEELL